MRFLIFILFLLMPVVPCHADQIVTESETCFGLIIENNQDQPSIQFAQWITETDSFTVRTFRRTRVTSLIQNIDQQRLQRLDFSNLGSVRNLAEELAGIPADESCRAIARRLCLLIVYHGEPSAENQSVVTSACLNLMQLHQSKEEEIRFERIAVAYGGLQLKPDKRFEASALPRSANSLQLLKWLRQEQFAQAFTLQEKMAVENQLTEELSQLAAHVLATRKVDDRSLQAILKLESEMLSGESNSQPLPLNWSLPLLPSEQTRPIRIEDVVDFDLEATVLIDGHWRRPGK